MAKKRGILRHWFQAAFFALTNGYVVGFLTGKIYQGNTKALCVPGLNCYSCPGALGSCPIGALQSILDSRTFTVSAYVFGFLMGFGALFGRFVCGWLCPFGLVQDLLYKIPFVKKVKNLPGHKYLRYFRYVVLVLFVLLLPAVIVDITGMGKPWFCEYICPSGTLFAGIPLVATNPDLQGAVGGLFIWKVSLLVLTGLLSVISYRPFCKYVCPLGAIYGWFNPVALYRYTVDPDKCTECSACKKVCKMDIDVWKHPNSPDCIRCGDCKNTCPENAISSTLDKMLHKNKK
ncbi:MAG: 4Fe-4S binding protein [Lachnospiraceae bacterium]|nr:4Fe-4S binding protein [Lachnospiraceae bacterium]